MFRFRSSNHFEKLIMTAFYPIVFLTFFTNLNNKSLVFKKLNLNQEWLSSSAIRQSCLDVRVVFRFGKISDLKKSSCVQKVVVNVLWVKKFANVTFKMLCERFCDIRNQKKRFLERKSRILANYFFEIWTNNLNRNLINIFMFVTPMCEWNPNIFPSFEYHMNLQTIQQNCYDVHGYIPHIWRTNIETFIYFELSSGAIMTSTSPFFSSIWCFDHLLVSHIFLFLTLEPTKRTNHPYDLKFSHETSHYTNCSSIISKFDDFPNCYFIWHDIWFVLQTFNILHRRKFRCGSRHEQI